jgi:hypothetical protein
MTINFRDSGQQRGKKRHLRGKRHFTAELGLGPGIEIEKEKLWLSTDGTITGSRSKKTSPCSASYLKGRENGAVLFCLLISTFHFPNFFQNIGAVE